MIPVKMPNSNASKIRKMRKTVVAGGENPEQPAKINSANYKEAFLMDPQRIDR